MYEWARDVAETTWALRVVEDHSNYKIIKTGFLLFQEAGFYY